jgi:hypothetical protein
LVVPQGGENNAAADIALYDKKRQSVKNKAEYFSERLVDYFVSIQVYIQNIIKMLIPMIYPDTQLNSNHQ